MVNDVYYTRDGSGPPQRRRCQTTDHTAYLEWIHELENSTTTYWESELARSFQLSFMEACAGRQLFLTKKRYFGIGPFELEEGDEVYILAGGKLPLILRPSPNSQPNEFELVGDCYVHGIMDGEAVSGSGQSTDPDLPLRDFHDVFIV